MSTKARVMAGRKDRAPKGRTVGRKSGPRLTKIRKKPCPLCGKKLQAKSKSQWRNNLARHAANCREYQREAMLMGMRIVSSLCEFLMPGALATSYPRVTARAEVEELERLHSIESPEGGKSDV